MEQYWASLPAEQVGGEIQKRIDDFYHHLEASGLFRRIQKAYNSYYGISKSGFDSSNISAGGKAGELKKIKISHYRSVLQTILNMTTKDPPTFSARAINSDSESMAQVKFSEGLLDYYKREKSLNAKLRDAAELALSMTEGWLVRDWNPALGQEVTADIESGRIVKGGDIDIHVKGPLDIAREVRRQDNKHEWIAIGHELNKWNVVALKPELTEVILNEDTYQEKRLTLINYDKNNISTPSSDLVRVWEFRHVITPAMPKGRRLFMLPGGRVFDDELWEWDSLMASSVAPSPLHMTAFSYTPAFDLLVIQDALDTLYSAAFTNQATFGVQNVWSRKGDGLTVTQLGTGLQHFQTLEMPPQAINLTHTPPEIFSLINMFKQDLELLSGANSTVRGNPPEGVKAGNAMALLASQAIQFNSGFQESLYTLAEETATDIIRLTQKHATTERPAHITGRFNRTFVHQYSGKNISRIARVFVERVNPLSKTTAGKVQIADSYAQQGWIKHPSQYQQLLETGRMEPLTEGDFAEFISIKSENEKLLNGKYVQAIIFENHPLHIAEHRALLNTPEAKENPKLVAAVTQHILEHEILWPQLAQRSGLLAASGIMPPPLPPPPGPAPMEQPPGAPAPSGPPDSPVDPAAANPPQGTPPVNMPTNPLTNEEFNMQNGGIS